jgi:hypothetical protein
MSAEGPFAKETAFVVDSSGKKRHLFGARFTQLPKLTSRRGSTTTMSTSNINADVRSRIDQFLEELSALVKNAALDSVRAALGDGAAPAKRGRGRPRSTVPAARRGKTAQGARGKRTSEQVDQMAERIQTFVRSNPGLRLEAIAEGIGTSSKELKLPIIKLLGTKSLSKTGQKRGTKYFAGGSGPRAGKSAPAGKRRRKQARKQARKQGRKQGRKQARKQGRKPGHKRAKRAARKAAVAVAA